MLGERVAASFDFFVGGLYFWGFKWWFSDEHGITGLIERYIITPTDQISTS